MVVAVKSVVAELRRWPRARWITAGATWLILLMILAGMKGDLQPPAIADVVANDGWWTLPAIVGAAALAALTIATYIRTAPGSDATVCDLRWPLFGLIGTLLATGSPGAGPFAGFLVGAAGSPAYYGRLALAVAAIGVLLWGLADRLRSERSAREAARRDDEAPIVCTTCRPLFPAGRSADAPDITRVSPRGTTGHNDA